MTRRGKPRREKEQQSLSLNSFAEQNINREQEVKEYWIEETERQVVCGRFRHEINISLKKCCEKCRAVLYEDATGEFVNHIMELQRTCQHVWEELSHHCVLCYARYEVKNE